MRTIRVAVCALALLLVNAPGTMADDMLADGLAAKSPESAWCEPCGYSCAQKSCCDQGCCGGGCGCGCGFGDCGCDGCCGDMGLGCILPSDHCFDRFISPISNPFFFEDPRSLTEVRAIYIDNKLPDSIGGGDVDVWAAQVRLRFAERWSVIAPRLGYIDVHQPGAPVGYMSSPVGVKYNFYRDVCRQQLASVGMTYFIPGESSAFSDWGDGDFHFFLSGGAQVCDCGHWLSGTGFRIPSDSYYGTQMWYWSNQWDYEVTNGWYGLFGVNWFHWMRSAGAGLQAPVAGLDVLNLPVSGVAGDDVVTGVVGTKLKPNRHAEVGIGYEFPMTNRTDILENRLYLDLTLRY